jgi:hypothetical protein
MIIKKSSNPGYIERTRPFISTVAGTSLHIQD